jgi:hypothetical protein
LRFYFVCACLTFVSLLSSCQLIQFIPNISCGASGMHWCVLANSPSHIIVFNIYGISRAFLFSTRYVYAFMAFFYFKDVKYFEIWCNIIMKTAYTIASFVVYIIMAIAVVSAEGVWISMHACVMFVTISLGSIYQR